MGDWFEKKDNWELGKQNLLWCRIRGCRFRGEELLADHVVCEDGVCIQGVVACQRKVSFVDNRNSGEAVLVQDSRREDDQRVAVVVFHRVGWKGGFASDDFV